MAEPEAAFAEALRERYSIKRELGRGGMAIVYLARDARHDRPVALKLLRPELGSTIGPERFQREVRLVARLQHPHILPIFDSGETAGRLWYTMPFVEGESLRERLRREVQLPWSEAVRLACEIAGALEYAHREGAVHRDIKPENVLLSDGQALVADFGVAKAVQDGWDEQLTETGLALGTPSYMSPEQAAGGRVDGRSDIYALGCVLYEMLAGEPPYTGPTAQVVIAKRFSDPVPSIRRLRPEVPTFVDATILRALARSPADRFGSPAEFITALQAAPRDRSRRRWMVVPALIAAAVVGYAVVTSRAPAPGRTSNSTNTRLAVLPLENIGDPADAFFAQGVSDEIRGQLSRTPDLTVLARATVQRIANDAKSPQEIARALGVGYLLAGTVRWARDSGSGRIQVRPELIRARDGATQWQETYDAPLGDLFRIQAGIADQVAREVVTALGTPTRPQAASGVGTRAIPNTDSYLRYLRGQAELDRYTQESIRQAERLFSEAIALDSTFGEAYAGLADALNFATDHVAPRQVLGRMRTAARRAVELAPESPVAHTALGGVQFWFDWDFPAAERSLRRALELDPNHARAYHYLTYLLADLGRADEALAVAHEARLRDPLSSDAARVQFVPLYESQRYADVIALAKRELAIDSANGAAIEFLGGALVRSGRAPDGLALLRQEAAARPTCGMQRMLATSLAFAGERAAAQAILAMWRQRISCPGTPEPYFAAVFASLGESDSAFSWLDRGYAARVPHMVDLRLVQDFARLRGDPRYPELLRRVGLPAH